MRSTLATLRYLGTLSPAQRQALRSKHIEGEFSAVELLELLRPLAEFDGMNDRARGKTVWIIVLLVIAIVITLFVGIELNAAVAYGIIGVLTLIAVALLAMELRLRNLDVSNNLRRIALPFLAVLREDTPRDAPLNVRIDLTKPTSKAKMVEKRAPYKRGRYHSIVDTLYQDQWFSGSAKLADNSRLRWEVVDDVVHRHCSKRNARGKTKWKSKYSKRSQLNVTVSLPLQNYQFGELKTNTGTRAAVSSNDKRTVVKLSRKLKSRSLNPFDVTQLIDLVSSAYRPVSPAAVGAAS